MLRFLHNRPSTRHPDLLVGIESADDAGVFRIGDDLALVQSVDFFTPIVDEPGDWGRIAAANALSDIYAMGASPVTALQLVGWPRKELPFELLGEVLAGAAEVLEEAGVTLLGGHSVDDPEPKFGLAVTGTVHPDRILTNRGSQPGDALVLTKPIGTGVVTTGIKRGVVATDVRDAAVRSMVALNDVAGEAAVAAGASAATDVTGFGLLGHLGEMLQGVGAVIEAGSVPMLPGAEALAADGVAPGGTKRNLAHARGFTDFAATPDHVALLLADAQTSGGLLIAVAPSRLEDLLPSLTRSGVFAGVVGSVTADQGRVVVR